MIKNQIFILSTKSSKIIFHTFYSDTTHEMLYSYTWQLKWLFHWKGHMEVMLIPVFNWSQCLCLLSASVFSVVFCSYIHPLHTIISQRYSLLPLPLGDPTPHLFIFNHQLYVELTFRSVPYALFSTLGFKSTHTIPYWKPTFGCPTSTSKLTSSNVHFKLPLKKPRVTSGSSPATQLTWQDSPTPLTKSQCSVSP